MMSANEKFPADAFIENQSKESQEFKKRGEKC